MSHNPVQRTHGFSGTLAYQAWGSMVARCRNPKRNRFYCYGARGITVDQRWLKYENFLSDMGPRPHGMTIERIDNNGPYTKTNCRWATLTEQARNKSTNRILTHNGESLPLAAWAERAKIPYKTFHARIQSGWALERALTTGLIDPKTRRPYVSVP